MSKPIYKMTFGVPGPGYNPGFSSAPASAQAASAPSQKTAPMKKHDDTAQKASSVFQSWGKRKEREATPVTPPPSAAAFQGAGSAPSAFNSPVRKSNPQTSFSSPQKADSPMRYHFSDGIEAMKNRDLKKLNKKPLHTLAPDSAESQIKIARAYWTDIKAARKQLSDEVQEIVIEKRNGKVILTVSSDGVQVESGGTIRMIGFHEVERTTGRAVRPFPIATISGGNECFPLPGAVFAAARAEYDKTPSPPPFYDFFKEWYKQNGSSESDSESPSPMNTPSPGAGARSLSRLSLSEDSQMSQSPSPAQSPLFGSSSSSSSNSGAASMSRDPSPAPSPVMDENPSESDAQEEARPAKRARVEPSSADPLPLTGKQLGSSLKPKVQIKA